MFSQEILPGQFLMNTQSKPPNNSWPGKASKIDNILPSVSEDDIAVTEHCYRYNAEISGRKTVFRVTIVVVPGFNTVENLSD